MSAIAPYYANYRFQSQLPRNLPGALKRLRLRRCGRSGPGYCFIEHENQPPEQHQGGESAPPAFNAATAWEDHPLILRPAGSWWQYTGLGIVTQ